LTTSTTPGTGSAPATAADRPPPRVQLSSLVGLRTILSLFVFSFHVALAFVFADDASRTVARLDVGFAEAALACFFMLSGFVLTWVARSGEPYRVFFRRRLVKIFPNHVVTWTAGLILMIAFGVYTSWWEVLPSLFLVQAWIPVESVLEGPNGPSWSLCCELFMYALFPLLLAWGIKLDARRLWRWMVIVGGGVMVLTAIVGLTVPSEPKAIEGTVSVYQIYVLIFFPLPRLADFVLGVLVARLVITGRWRPVRARWVWLLLGAGWAFSMLLPPPLGFVAPFLPVMVTLLGNLASADLDGSANFFTRPSMMWLGDRSFAFYLVHGNVLIYGERAFGQGPYPWPYAVLFVAGVLGVSIVLAHLLHTRVENPAMKRWARARPRPVPAAASEPQASRQ